MAKLILCNRIIALLIKSFSRRSIEICDTSYLSPIFPPIFETVSECASLFQSRTRTYRCLCDYILLINLQTNAAILTNSEFCCPLRYRASLNMPNRSERQVDGLDLCSFLIYKSFLYILPLFIKPKKNKKTNKHPAVHLTPVSEISSMSLFTKPLSTLISYI